jgi:Lon-like ATP-dependent protease
LKNKASLSNDFETLGHKNGRCEVVDVLSTNRYDYSGKLIKLTTSNDKELLVTPEHKIAVLRNGHKLFISASELLDNEALFFKDSTMIIDEFDIINTYNQRQKNQCKLYREYSRLRKKYPEYGYKRIAKLMNQPIGKTRWWHSNTHVPVPIQTIEWLKSKNLLPLKVNDKRLPKLARLIGSTFGDGGIFENLNGVFLSSSELSAVKQFQSDIEEIFGLDVGTNSRIIEGGEYGHSWCYQNTNRNIIRFLLALGAPLGNKTKKELVTPSWIALNNSYEDNFFGALFGSGLGVPKIHISKRYLQTLDFAICGLKEHSSNRVTFIERIKSYLNKKGINTGKISRRTTSNKNLDLHRLLISTKFDNFLKFVSEIKLHYCDYKQLKLKSTLDEFIKIKNKRFNELLNKGLGAEQIMQFYF